MSRSTSDHGVYSRPTTASVLRRERENSKLLVNEIPLFLEGKDYTEMKRRFRNTMLRDPVFAGDNDLYYLDREEAFARAGMKTLHYMRAVNKLGILDFEERTTMRESCNQILPCDLHENLFIPAITSQGSREQQAKWLQLANRFSIIGAYAQTELGHGSNIKDLETTATYDPSSEQFVLNCPTITSMKWWPGSLGHVATHAVVMARLITKGEDHGVHFFLVQLRSLKDHTPLPGIELGDVGPCLGFIGVNNGFLRLKNVRIPRQQMLMKHAKVFACGKYLKPAVKKINYAPMINTRVLVAFQGAVVLFKAVAIATRYSFVRQEPPEGIIRELEPGMIDHQTQQHKLLPLLATVYAFYTTGEYILALNEQALSQFENNQFDLLPELHATACGLKAFMTHTASNGIEMCRLACGIHGYSLSSGLPTLFADSTVYQTLEGENTILQLQLARFLKKQFDKQLSQSQLPVNITYLAADYIMKTTCEVKCAEHFSDTTLLLEAYHQRARKMVEMASLQYQEALDEGIEESEAWNESSVDWTNAARAHCYYVVLKAFSETVDNTVLSATNEAMMKTLLSLFAVSGIMQYLGEFMLDGYMSTSQIALARQHLYSLLTVVRKETVTLVDALDFPDELLNSTLGRYDGAVYTNLYQWAKGAPRNKSEVHQVYHTHIRPLLMKREHTCKL